MKGIFKLYKWELNNELYTGLYFASMLSMYSIEVLLHGERSVDILIMLEMLCVCYIVSIVQKIIFTDDSNFKGKSLIIRTIVWFVFSILLITTASFLFHWFVNLQLWALGAFIACMVICFIIIWTGMHIANRIDTKNLNHMLSNYQEKRK